MRFHGILALLILASAASAGDDNIDRVTLKEKGAIGRWIISETMDEMKWKEGPDGQVENTTKRNLIKKVVYAFQIIPGAYTQGMEARQGGRHAIAAALFGQLAAGNREPEKVIGSFEEAVSYELDGKFDNAAKSFAKIVEGFPKHPLVLDAQYRMGITLAQAKNTAEAEAVAKKLDELGKGRIGQPAIVRAAAIRAALAQQAGKDSDFRTNTSKAAFNSDYDRASWMHFNLYLADTFRTLGKDKEATDIYERMLRGLTDDPANAARVRLGLGICKASTDPEGAILDLLTLDALPFGSSDQKCEARYHAGRLLLAAALEAQKDPAIAKDERKSAFMTENLRTVKLLLSAAADATSNLPAKAQAAELLKTLVVEAPKVEAAPAAAGEPAKADPAKKDEAAKKDEPAKKTEPAKKDDKSKPDM